MDTTASALRSDAMSAATTEFEGLYAKHAPDVYRFALYLSADRGAAEDITAETFARAWAARASIEAATVKGYLFTIARNLFLQGRRGAGRHVPLDPEMPGRDAGPHDHAVARDELRVVLAELQRLPELDRAAILMRAVHDMPYEEIARALGLSLVAVKVKIHRARLALSGIGRAPKRQPIERTEP